MKYLLGIDIGTSSTKTVLFKKSGDIVASASREYSLSQPQNGWAEQDPNDWWDATYKTIREVIDKSSVPPHDILGLGLSGQMHGLVMLDNNGNVLRPAIIWCDQRTNAECEEITNLVGDRLIAITANPALTGFTASKILWVKHNQPDLYTKCAHILLPKDYIRYKLTGVFATDVTDASGMQLLDVPNRCWSKEVLNALDIDINLLPKVYESAEATGNISQDACKLTGLTTSTIVAGGAGDQAAAAIGNGIIRNGKVSCSIGSSGVVFAHTDKLLLDKSGRVHTFCHAVPGAYHIMGVTQGAGLSLKWFKDNFYSAEAKKHNNVYSIIDSDIEQIEAGCDGVIYLPYLMGERTPHLDPYARGVFFGLNASHTRAHLARAVMEGISFSLLDCLNVMRELNIAAQEVRVSGGGARSPLWRQMLADMFDLPIALTNSTEAGALGVAILAGVACGLYKDVFAACDTMIIPTAVTTPNSNEIYKKNYNIYKKLYIAIKDLYRL